MRRTTRYIVSTTLGSVLLLATFAGTAQQAEPKDIAGNFVRVLNLAVKRNVNVTMDIRYSANLITKPDDTLSIRGDYYLRPDQAYIRMGEQEQLMNDSVALLISDNMQRMILYPKAAPMIKHIRSLPGLQWSDSSLKSLAAQFKILQAGKGTITMHSKLLLAGTKQPRVSYELTYDPLLSRPHQLVMTQRTLVGMDSLQYEYLQQDAANVPSMFIKNGQYFFIKEKKLTIRYTKIEYPEDGRLPVTMPDRIGWMAGERPKPVGKYLNYELVNAE